ncbi:hypothetical protein C8R47DRAFT_1157235 [Mycena vitilis]|nr:hypothetical protein C8R47DRAFT_1157235 [Mycena vitilis]
MADSSDLTSTYGAWLIALFLETIMYGVGVLQTFLYFQWWTDSWYTKAPVILAIVLDSAQLFFFFLSTYLRFVEDFGVVQADFIWADFIQLIANYLATFTVQIHFATQIYRLMRPELRVFKTPVLCTRAAYVVILLAMTQLAAGIAQAIMLYRLRSFSRLDETKAITMLQTAASLACDIAITSYLYLFLAGSKGGPHTMVKTEKLLNALMVQAASRGLLTAISSTLTMILFLIFPDAFWFLLSVAPNSKIYLNCMLAALNLRRHVRDIQDNPPAFESAVEFNVLTAPRTTVSGAATQVEIQPSDHPASGCQ